VPHVALVTARELGDPVAMVVLVEPDHRTLHAASLSGIAEDVRHELQVAIETRKELGQELEPQIADAFVQRIEKTIAERGAASERELKRRYRHRTELTLGAMALSIPLLAIAAAFTGLAGVIVVCAALAVIAVTANR
jgi:hypothetical protein